MKPLTYESGEEIKQGDHVRYHGETGEVEFVVTSETCDRSRDWYLEELPGGGCMVSAEGFGSVFIGERAIDEQLEFVSRANCAKERMTIGEPECQLLCRPTLDLSSRRIAFAVL